jgi:hypothetical protein
MHICFEQSVDTQRHQHDAACMSLQPEEDEEVGPQAGTPPLLVRAEYAWLSVAKRGAHGFVSRCFGAEWAPALAWSP